MFKILTTLLFLFFSLSQTAFARDHYCHGALGMQCGEARLGQVGFCKVILEPIPVALCGVNAGSWRHDECCAKQPANNPGMMCNGGGERSTQCQREWNTAVTRFTASPYTQVSHPPIHWPSESHKCSPAPLSSRARCF